MTREELIIELRGMIGPRYWVLDGLMELVDSYADQQVLGALETTEVDTY